MAGVEPTTTFSSMSTKEANLTAYPAPAPSLYKRTKEISNRGRDGEREGVRREGGVLEGIEENRAGMLIAR